MIDFTKNDIYESSELETHLMDITMISDLHGHYPELQGGDLLIIAGDITARDKISEWNIFHKWMTSLDYKKIVYIGGNHDGFLEQCLPTKNFISMNYLDPEDEKYEYLCDSGTEFEGLKIYGSPWTPEFMCWNFMKKRGQELKEVWDKIPMDTDILITHGPPYGILDKVTLSSRGDEFKHAGDEELRIAVERVKPLFHAFGHIHEQGGKKVHLKHEGCDTICVNASIMNEDYEPVNKPIRIEM